MATKQRDLKIYKLTRSGGYFCAWRAATIYERSPGREIRCNQQQSLANRLSYPAVLVFVGGEWDGAVAVVEDAKEAVVNIDAFLGVEEVTDDPQQ